MSDNSKANDVLSLDITWSGHYACDEVIKRFNDSGSPPLYDGADYGLYQIYGKHILNGADTLLYIGRATQQTFSTRFRAHRDWLIREDEIKIFLGRIYDRDRHFSDNNWAVWERDVVIAECLLIHKYSPNYNSVSIAEQPSLIPYREATLNHFGRLQRLSPKDEAPGDW